MWREPHILLAAGIGDMVLAPDHMGHAEQVVVGNDREVHQRVDMRLHLRVGGCVKDPECREVPHCRVRVIQVGFDPYRDLALLESVVEHLLPQFQVLFHRLVAAGAGGLLLPELPEMLVVAGADISPAFPDQLLTEIVIQGEPVALGYRLGNTEPQPSEVLDHHLVRIRIHPFRVGILDAEDVPPAVVLHVGIVEGCGTGMPDMERAGRVGSKPHDNPFFRLLKVGKHFPVLVLFRKGGKHFRGPGLERADTCLGGESSDVGDSLLCKAGYFLCPAPQFRVGTHHHADDSTGLRDTAMFHGVLECA